MSAVCTCWLCHRQLLTGAKQQKEKPASASLFTPTIKNYYSENSSPRHIRLLLCDTVDITASIHDLPRMHTDDFPLREHLPDLF